MKAVLCHEFGLPETLTLGEIPSPQPGPGEVLIGIHACGLNFAGHPYHPGVVSGKTTFPFQSWARSLGGGFGLRGRGH